MTFENSLKIARAVKHVQLETVFSPYPVSLHSLTPLPLKTTTNQRKDSYRLPRTQGLSSYPPPPPPEGRAPRDPVGSGHVSPTIWEITIKVLKGGAR